MLEKRHFVLAIVAMGTAFPQTFEVASVKSSPSTGGRFIMNGGPGSSDPDRIVYTNITLKRILLSAFDVRNYQISGPDFLDTLRFDITAKVPEGATKIQFQRMLQDLLGTRFQMRAHRESRELPLYALLVAKNGPKIKPTSAGPAGEEQLAAMRANDGKDGFPVLSLQAPGLVIETRNGRARITAKDVPLAKLADLLSGEVSRPVVDETGLEGNYSFALYFTPESSTSGDEPFLFPALQQQLGLRLEPRKGALEMLLIDHIERVPTGN
jgi:uncharacterized protein (TIGR03435 family)